MKFEAINRAYTEKVAEYLAKGYVVNTSTMSGSQSDEIARIDLTDGKEIIRILLERGTEETETVWYHYIALVVGKVTENSTVKPHSARANDTIWNHRLETIDSTRFYEISEGWYGTKTEVDARHELVSKRYRYQSEYRTKEMGDKAKRIALSYVRRQPRCKSMKLSDISSVTRVDAKYRYSTTTHSRYVIEAKNHRFVLNLGE